MSTIAFTLTFATPDAEDVRGAKYDIAKENTRLTAENAAIVIENARRAALNPPLPPLPLKSLLPFATPAELRASYQSLLLAYVKSQHKINVWEATEQANQNSTTFQEIKRKFAELTPTKQQAVLDLINAP